MSAAKDDVRKMLTQIPEDASLEDIQYHIYVMEKVERGLKAAEEGRLLSDEDVERRLARWLGE